MGYTSGNNIYKYSLENRIGGGNFGEVWTATDLALNTKVAVKLLDQSQYSIDERLLEAQIGNRLQHANVVNIKGADVIDVAGSPVVVISMPYFEKGSVVSQLNSLNFLDLQKIIKCVIDVLRGLEYLHENGYYHCDIKPNNILVGNQSEYLLTDYGITCYAPDHGAVQPKQSYLPHIAPETISSNLYDTRTDIYQLGLTAFRLINGISEIRAEFDKDKAGFTQKVIKGTIVASNKYKPYVPHSLRRIINKAVSLEPDNRYQTALEMRRALERIQVSGDCTGDSMGNLILSRGVNTYRYEVVNIKKSIFSLTTYKRNLNSGNEVRFSKYCVKNLHEKDLKKQIQDFCLEIVCG